MRTDRPLRALLTLGALTWGCAAVGIVLPWSMALGGLQGLGAGDIPYDRMLDYWLRMTSGAFASIGMLFAAAAIRPARMSAMLPWLAALMIIEGTVIGLHGMRLGLSGFPFLGDLTACFVTGLGILWCLKKRGAPDRIPDQEAAAETGASSRALCE